MYFAREMLKVVFLGAGLFQEDPAMGFAVRLAVAFAVFPAWRALSSTRSSQISRSPGLRCVGHLSDALDVSSPCPGTELEQSDASEVGARSGDNNEQSISFFFEQLDISVFAPGEPVNGIGCGARHARQSR